MKSPLLITCLLTALCATALPADNLVKNGDFESGTGPEFYTSEGWYNRGTGLNQGGPARSDSGKVIAGLFSASVNDRYVTADEKFGPTAHVQKTDYVIKEGDAFSLNYQWCPADDYWQRATDTIRFVLYATSNDKVGGPVIWSSELTSDFFRGKEGSVMAVDQQTEEVNADAVGANLFVMFYGVDTANGGLDSTPHWARVDDIEVRAIKADEAP